MMADFLMVDFIRLKDTEYNVKPFQFESYQRSKNQKSEIDFLL